MKFCGFNIIRRVLYTKQENINGQQGTIQMKNNGIFIKNGVK